MSNSYGVIHDWWFWVILVVFIITGLILLVCKLVLEFPGLCDWKNPHLRRRDPEDGMSMREISSTFVRKISGRGRYSHDVKEEEITEETGDVKFSGQNKKRPRNDQRVVDENVITKNEGNKYPLYKQPREFIRKLSRRGNEGRTTKRNKLEKENTGQTVSHDTENIDDDVRNNTEDISDVELRYKKTKESYLRGRVKRSQEFVRKISGHGVHDRHSRKNRDPGGLGSQNNVRNGKRTKPLHKFVRKISGHGLHNHRSRRDVVPGLRSQNNVRNGKKTKSSLHKFVRKISQRGTNRFAEDQEEEEDFRTNKEGDQLQSVIRITAASGKGPLKITKDFVRKISLRGRDIDVTKCNRGELAVKVDADVDVEEDENQARTRKPGVFVVYYCPTETDPDLEDIQVIPMEFDKVGEESKKEKLVPSINICDETAVEGRNIKVIPKKDTSLSRLLMEEAC